MGFGIMTQQEKVKRIAQIIKARFPNLTVAETIDLAFTIAEAVNDEKLEERRAKVADMTIRESAK